MYILYVYDIGQYMETISVAASDPRIKCQLDYNPNQPNFHLDSPALVTTLCKT